MRKLRLLVGSFVAGLVAVVVSVGLVVPPANAATIVPPSPVTILPSVVTGATGTGTAFGNNALGIMYKFWMDPKTHEAWKILEANRLDPIKPPPTAGQTALVDGYKSNIRVPATKFGGLVKGAGAVGVAVTGYEVGAWLGHGTLELLGMDPDGTVCSNVGDDFIGTMVSSVSGADCAPFEAAREFIRNSDAAFNLSGPQRCFNGECMQLTGSALRSGGFTPDARTYCFQGHINAGDNSSGALLIKYTGNTTSSSVVYRANKGYNSACQTGGFQAGINQASATVTRSILEYGWAGSAEPMAPVTETQDNPLRTFRCVTVGTNNQQYSGTSLSFTEKDSVFPRPKCQSPPAGVGVRSTRILESPGQVGQPEHELYNQDTTPEYQSFKDVFPECDSQVCILDLRSSILGVASCLATPEACTGWFQQPDKERVWECTYKGTVVALSECTTYAPSFEPSTQVTGPVLGNPTTGAPMANPKPEKGTDTGTFGSPIQNPEKDRQCMPTGWGMLNPVEWVMKPVGCALEKAFVPRESVVKSVIGKIDKAWNGKLPAVLVSSVSSWQFVAPPSGCAGITVDVFFLGPPFQIMNACPGSTLADMAFWSRFFGNVMVTLYAVVAITRHVGRVIGFGGLGGGDS